MDCEVTFTVTPVTCKHTLLLPLWAGGRCELPPALRFEERWRPIEEDEEEVEEDVFEKCFVRPDGA